MSNHGIKINITPTVGRVQQVSYPCRGVIRGSSLCAGLKKTKDRVPQPFVTELKKFRHFCLPPEIATVQKRRHCCEQKRPLNISLFTS